MGAPANLAQLRASVLNDPDIQRVLQAEAAKLAATRDQGGAARDYQNGIRDLVSQIAKQKGLLPDGYFVNPNDGQLEEHRGWSGMSGWQKALSIGGLAAATLATAGAFGLGPGAALFGGGGGGAASATGAGAATSAGTAAGAGGVGAGTVSAVGGGAGLGSQFLRYGLQYGAPIVGGIVSTRMANNAQRDSDAAMMDYYTRALDAAKEDRDYQRQFAEDERAYQRNRYANLEKNLEPYRRAGMTASERLEALLARSSTPNGPPRL